MIPDEYGQIQVLSSMFAIIQSCDFIIEKMKPMHDFCF